jgi:hypothetical protein
LRTKLRIRHQRLIAATPERIAELVVGLRRDLADGDRPGATAGQKRRGVTGTTALGGRSNVSLAGPPLHGASEPEGPVGSFIGYQTLNVGTAMSSIALAFAVLDSGHGAVQAR